MTSSLWSASAGRRAARPASTIPNIVQIYDRGEAEGTYYIAMEYLEGRSLKEIIVKYAPLSPDLLVSISVQIVEALRFAHRRDVIHRDIKPQNIIIDNDGRVKVTDFGIARAGSASTMTEAGFHPGHRPLLLARTGAGTAGGGRFRPVLVGHRDVRDGHRQSSRSTERTR